LFLSSTIDKLDRRQVGSSQRAAGTEAFRIRDGTTVADRLQLPTLIAAGRTLGGCRVERLLGRGGMAEVYLARHLALDKPVALKILPPSRLEPRTVERFFKEARVAAQIEHPNVVTIYDVGEQDGHYYIVMQYVEGKNLSELLEVQGGPLPWRTALAVVRQAGKGLAAVHARGLVHRDIKPANIMVAQARRVLLMDFGLVREETQSDLTQTGAIVGTPAFMSPEQCRGENVDKRSDVFSLGATLYSLLTARLPYQGPAHSVMSQIASGAIPTPVHELNRYVPLQVGELVAKMMAYRPAQRMPDADVVVQEIARCLELAEPPHQEAVDTTTLAPVLTIVPDDLAPIAGDGPGTDRRRRALWWAAGLCACCALPLVAVMLHIAVGDGAAKPNAPANTTVPFSLPADVFHAGEMVYVPEGRTLVGDSRTRLREHFLKIDDLRANPDLLNELLAKWPSTETRQVHVPGFWIDRYEVTNADYAEFVRATGHRPPTHWQGASPAPGSERHPVAFVNHDDASAFAKWASKKLPTEEQWLRAFRGDDGRLYPWGDEIDMRRAAVPDNSAFAAPPDVDSSPQDRSACGVYNLLGNVREIMRDVTVTQGLQQVLLKGADWDTRGDRFGIASWRVYWIGPGLEVNQVGQVGFRCVVEKAN
jgi:formylglycine-generating enzyme required for sulfatase activity/tRNA A-37 threonylcarbamoyl transferase component Bud32